LSYFQIHSFLNLKKKKNTTQCRFEQLCAAFSSLGRAEVGEEEVCSLVFFLASSLSQDPKYRQNPRPSPDPR